MQPDRTIGQYNILERFLNLRRSDLKRGLPLFFYHFLIISSLVIGQIVRDTLFLERFEAVHLPYVDMTIAGVVLFVVTGYTYFRRYVSLSTLQIGSLFGFAVIAGLFWLSTWIYQWTWLYPSLYIWVGILGVLAPVQMWILIIHLLSVRNKRLLGIVTSGGIAGGLAGFLSRVIVQRFEAEHLLFVMMILLAGCGVLVMWIIRQWRPTLLEMEFIDDENQPDRSLNLRKNYQQIRTSSHLKMIAALVFLSAIVTYIAGWQFKAIAADSFTMKNDLAAFFGTFHGYVSILGFLIAQILTPRLLSFSLSVALVILPSVLLAGTFGVLAWGTLWSITFLKGSDKILRYSIEKPAVESLYFPIPPQLMTQVKMFIDTVSWRLGDGLAALIVFIFVTVLHLSARQISWITLPLLAVWLIVVFVARHRYVETLGESLHQHRLDAELSTTQTLDRTTTEMIAARLGAEDKDEILYALNLLGSEQYSTVHPAVRDLLAHPAAEVREKALSILNAAGDTSVISRIDHLLHDENLGVRTEALLFLAHHTQIDPLERIQQLGDFPDFTIRSAIITYLARSGDPKNLDPARQLLDAMVQEQGPDQLRTRMEAARLIGSLPDVFAEQLETLLNDPNTDVASQAILEIKPTTTPRIIRAVMEKLGDPDLTARAADSLGQFGDGIVDLLYERLLDASVAIEMRREIPGVLLRIGTPKANQMLIESLFSSDTKLRLQVITSLTSLQSRHPEFELDNQAIETILVAEIVGHFRSYQVQESLENNLDDDETILNALQESMQQDIERIFHLIKLLYPKHDLHSAYFGIQSENVKVRDNALEFLEQILKPELRNLLVPVLDPEVSFAQRVKLANRLIGTTIETPTEAILTLLDNPEPWLKSCAAYTIGILNLTSLEDKLDECLEHSDPLLRETAKQAKQRLQR